MTIRGKSRPALAVKLKMEVRAPSAREKLGAPVLTLSLAA
jgi:hypothetical protein